MSLRERNKSRRRERVLSAARDLIGTSGYDALTMRAVAHKAQVSVPTLYNLFGSKEEIVKGLRRQELSAIALALPEAASASGLDRARAIVEVAVDRLTADSAFHRAGILAFREDVPEDDPTTHDAVELMRTALEDAITEGRLRRDVPANLVAAHLLQTFRHQAFRWATGSIDDRGLRTGLLFGFYVCAMACATESTRMDLSKELQVVAKALGTQIATSAA